MAGSPEYLELLDQMRDLHVRKNAGYAGQDNPDAWANFRMSESFGVPAATGVLVRLSDKYIRLQNLMRDSSNDQVGESIEDTALDLAAYALIFVCLRREQQRVDEGVDRVVDRFNRNLAPQPYVCADPENCRVCTALPNSSKVEIPLEIQGV